jgi:predicted Zn-dependent peptidase
MRIRKTAFVGVALAAMTAMIALPAAAQVKDYQKIKYPPLPEFKIAEPDVYQLENGLTVFLLEDHELPLISVSARIRTGSNYDLPEKVGLADLMATVQRTGGTKSMTGDEIDDYLAVRAVNIETGMGGSSGFASMSCLADVFDDAFAVFADILRNPVFSEDKLEVAKVQSNAGIARRNDNVNGITNREFRRLIYGPDSPLSDMEEYATIAAVTRADLMAFHRAFYHPNAVYLGVVGDFDTEKMKDKIKATFGDWPTGPKFVPPEIAYDKEMTPGVYFIEKSDVNQANVRLGHLGIRVDNPDYFAVQVLNEVLGGGFSARLFSNVRTEKGLAYNVFGSIGSSFVQPGIFSTGLSTKSETMSEAVEALRTEIDGIIDNPPSDEEMARAKESILNSFVFRYDSKSEILSQQMLYAYYGLPSDFLETYRDRVEKVTKEQVTEAAKKYIHPDKLKLLVVGNAESFDKPLSTFGEVTTIDIAIPSPPETAPAIEKTPEALAAGAGIIESVRRTLGGEEPGSLRAIRRAGTVKINVQGMPPGPMQTEMLLVLPDKMRMVLQTPVGDMTIVFNGDDGFRMMGGQVFPVQPSMVVEARAELWRDLAFLTAHLGDPGLEAVAGGEEEVDGDSCRIVGLTLDDVKTTLCVDDRGRVLEQTYSGKHPIHRTPGQIEAIYSDYRSAGDRQFPFYQVVRYEGQDVQEFDLEEVEFNPEVDMSVFERP